MSSVGITNPAASLGHGVLAEHEAEQRASDECPLDAAADLDPPRAELPRQPRADLVERLDLRGDGRADVEDAPDRVLLAEVEVRVSASKAFWFATVSFPSVPKNVRLLNMPPPT
jgi:hypothetical protein